jgi:hypothetical protein
MGFLTIKPRNTAKRKQSINKNSIGRSEAKAKKTVQEFLDIQRIENNIIFGSERSKYYIRLTPKNINILTDEFLLNEIYQLKSVCNITQNIEFLVVDKVERLEDNRNYIEKLLNKSDDDIYRTLLEKDLEYFKELETSKSSSREFYFIIPFKNADFKKLQQQFIKVEQVLENRGFTILECNEDILKNMLQVYLERNFSGEVVKDFDI